MWKPVYLTCAAKFSTEISTSLLVKSQLLISYFLFGPAVS